MKHLLLPFLMVLFLMEAKAQSVIRDWAVLPARARPYDIVFDASGNLYTANFGLGTVSKVTPVGMVTPAWATVEDLPISLTVDGSGNVFVSNYGSYSVSKITPGGMVTPKFAVLQGISQGHVIIADADGNLYTGNYNANTVSKITPDGTVTPVWASLDPRSGPVAAAFDGTGNLYIANADANTVSKIMPDGTIIKKWASVAGNPSDIIIDPSGNLYTANVNGNSVSKISPDGTVIQDWVQLPSGAGTVAVAMDASGIIYAANQNNNTVSRIMPDGSVIEAWATVGQMPHSILVDADGNVYTANQSSHSISKIIPAAINPALSILFVDSAAAPAGDGSSWATAITSLDKAIRAAGEINEIAGDPTDSVRQIWVAKGTYFPQQDSAFAMLPKVKILGSFAGTESSLSDRDYSQGYTSVLEGNGNSVIRNDNTGLDTSAVLDGFVITGGTANGLSEQTNGGGIYNRSVSPTLRNLLVTGNSAAFGGGGMANISSSPLIVNVRLEDNTAVVDGGGIYNLEATALALYNTLIVNNTATYGGGIFNGRGTAIKLTGATISGNTATIHGGGLSSGYASVEMHNSIIWGNSGQDIGNEFYNEQSSVYLTYSLYNNSWESVHLSEGSSIDSWYGVTTDPSFMDPDAADYSLKQGSVAINKGDNTLLPAWDITDVNGQSRVVDDVVDLGAIEFAGSPLPVKMSAVKGKLTGDGHGWLEWSTFTEMLNKGFKVQQSFDGIHFVDIDFIASKGPGGNSSTLLQYHFDAGVLSGVKYYRVQQTDLSGHTMNSNVVRIHANKTQFHLTAYPNPARNYINVHIEGVIQLHPKITVIDLAGRVLIRQTLSGNDARLDLSSLAAGIYLIKYTDDKQHSVVRIVKP